MKSFNNTGSPPFVSLYVNVRRAVRGFFVRHPKLDLLIGRQLVQIDVALHGWGLLGHLKRQDRLHWKGLTLFYGPAEMSLINQLYLHGDYELTTQHLLEETLHDGSTFVDLGAHIGLFTLLAARRVGPEGRVFAFEPSPGTRRFLERNLATNQLSARVTVAPYATSDHRATLRFVDGPVSDASSVAQPGETEHVIEVEATSLDEYFAELGWPQVDLIKMDIEGQELRTLRGMSGLMARNPQAKVAFEYHRAQMARCQVDPAELFVVLGELGFKRFSVLFRERMPIDLPARLADLDDLARRANVNVLAER
jgi:FkbM family methyltransferase